jgi:hypothetical protein
MGCCRWLMVEGIGLLVMKALNKNSHLFGMN